ncbi:hypothetical protein HanPSC8_Chr05g0192271 [Helianthus annuus]|nr:hypothetical protein HanPSC8_Chr05g0192271 [Helianthus annuus]
MKVMRLQRLAFVAMEKESVGSSNVVICSNIDSPFLFSFLDREIEIGLQKCDSRMKDYRSSNRK